MTVSRWNGGEMSLNILQDIPGRRHLLMAGYLPLVAENALKGTGMLRNEDRDGIVFQGQKEFKANLVKNSYSTTILTPSECALNSGA